MSFSDEWALLKELPYQDVKCLAACDHRGQSRGHNPVTAVACACVCAWCVCLACVCVCGSVRACVCVCVCV